MKNKTFISISWENGVTLCYPYSSSIETLLNTYAGLRNLSYEISEDINEEATNRDLSIDDAMRELCILFIGDSVPTSTGYTYQTNRWTEKTYSFGSTIPSDSRVLNG